MASARRLVRAFGSMGTTVLLLGCASTGGATDVGDPATVSIVTGGGEVWEIRRSSEIRVAQSVTVSPADAWSVLADVYRDLGLDADIRDSSVRELGVSQFRFPTRFLNRAASDFFDCGLDPGLNRPLAGQVPINGGVTTRVLAGAGDGAGANLQTTLNGTARRSGGNAGIATCRSTGLLEVLIGEMVQARAGAAPDHSAM